MVAQHCEFAVVINCIQKNFQNDKLYVMYILPQ